MRLRSIWSLASTSHSRNGWGSCPLTTMGKSISLHVSTPCPMGNCYPWGMVSASASTYSTFLKFYIFLFFKCTLQYFQFLVQYSVIEGRNLVWLETYLTPTMTILVFFISILSTKQQWQSSTRIRSVWRRCDVCDTEYRSFYHGV